MAGDPNHPVPPAVPPTEIGYAIPPAPPSTWPTVIGVIAIIFGVFGCLAAIYAALSPLIAEAVSRGVSTSRPTGFELASRMPVLTVIGSLLALGLAILLLVGGITLIRRSASSRGLCVTWATLKILYAVANTAVSYFLMKPVLDEMAQTQAQGAGMPPGFMQQMMAFGMCVGFVWVLALPIFMLIWFSRAKIKEETASWSPAHSETMR
jgi:hypothetical protein